MDEKKKRSAIMKPVLLVVAILFVLTAGLAVAGLMSGKQSQEVIGEVVEEEYQSGFVIDEPGTYDSEDTAVIKEIDQVAGTITLMNIETGKYYTLTYDGTSMVKDKYGNLMAMSQAAGGDIVDVTFLKNKKSLTSMQLSNSAWSFEHVEKYNFNTLSKGAEVGSAVYSLQNNPVVISEGRQATLEDIVQGDVVSIRGLGNSVYSVIVESGHGYLRLSNDEYLKGGWIEVGQAVIQEITEDMMLVVPEGSYNVHITAGGIDVTKPVTIQRNQEVTLDVSDIKPEEPKAGRIIFTIKPSNAKIFIDGEEVDISKPVELEYGLHQLVAEAEGYETVTQFIKVGEAMANVNITMDEVVVPTPTQKPEETTTTVSANEVSSDYKVYIDSPSDVEVYLDNIYVGVSPVSFKKEEGTHTITLRKNGYVTKSYTVQVDDAKKDVTYSFSALVKEANSASTATNNSSSNSNSSSSGSSSSNSNSSSSGSSSSNSNSSSSGSSSSNSNSSSSGSSSSNSNSSSSGSSSSNSNNNSSGSSSSNSNSSSSGSSSSNNSSSSGSSSSNNSSSGTVSGNNSSSDKTQVSGGGIIGTQEEIKGGGIVSDGK